MVDLLTSSIEHPSSLAVEPLSGFIFWCDLGTVPRIERAGLAGEDRKVIVKDYIVRPVGLCVDAVQLRIYWVDDRLHSLSTSKYDGTALSTLLSLPHSLRKVQIMRIA